MPDTPTDGFPTYNHLATTSGFVNLSEGNLKATSAGNYHSPIGNTMYMSSGKWYLGYMWKLLELYKFTVLFLL